MKRVNSFNSRVLKILPVLSALIFLSLDSMCLTLAPGGGPPCGGVFGACIPIDGGVSFLLAAGAAYGGKKAYDTWKENS